MNEQRRHFELSSFQTIAVTLGLAAGICLVLLRDDILGSKFHADGLQIQRIALGEVDSQGDSSYGLVAQIYAALGLADNPQAAALLSYAVFVLFVFVVIKKYRAHRRAWAEVYVLVASLVLGAVFLGFYSKDVFVVAIVATLLARKPSIRIDILFVILACVYASYFRPYWYLVAVAYIVLRLIAWRVRRLSLLLLGAIACVVIVSLAIYISTGETPDHFRTKVNVNRFDSVNAVSMIRPFVPSSTLLSGVINNVITFGMLIIPIPLLALGGAYYLVLFLGISLLWVLFMRSAAGTFAATATNRNTGASSSVRATCVVLAFLSVQSVFEPDYGSAIRHLTPLLPLMLLSMWAQRPRVCNVADDGLMVKPSAEVK